MADDNELFACVQQEEARRVRAEEELDALRSLQSQGGGSGDALDGPLREAYSAALRREQAVKTDLASQSQEMEKAKGAIKQVCADTVTFALLSVRHSLSLPPALRRWCLACDRTPTALTSRACPFPPLCSSPR